MASLNLLTSPLPPPSPRLGSLPDPDEPETDPHDPTFKLPLWPASSYRDASQGEQEGLRALETRPVEDTQHATPGSSPRSSPQRCVQDGSQALRYASPSPFYSRSARRFRKGRPQFSTDHPAPGATTYARVPGSHDTNSPRTEDEYFEALYGYPVESFQRARLFANTMTDELYDDIDRSNWGEWVDVLEQASKEKNR